MTAATRALVAAMSTRVVPSIVEDSPSTADQAIREMYNEPEPGQLDFLLTEAKMLLAGYTIERIDPDLARTSLSSQARTELIILAADVLDRLVDELRTRESYGQFRLELANESSDLHAILPADLAENPVFKYAFRIRDKRNADAAMGPKLFDPEEVDDVTGAREKAQLMHYLYREVSAMINTQGEVIDAIAARLLDGSTVEGSIVQNIIARYYKTNPWEFWTFFEKNSFKKQLLRNTPGVAFEVSVPNANSYNYEPKKSLYQTMMGMFKTGP